MFGPTLAGKPKNKIVFVGFGKAKPYKTIIGIRV
jgi:hypothetical protein